MHQERHDFSLYRVYTTIRGMNIYQIITEMNNLLQIASKESHRKWSFEEKREGIVDSINARETKIR